jgi:hypothetical protein
VLSALLMSRIVCVSERGVSGPWLICAMRCGAVRLGGKAGGMGRDKGSPQDSSTALDEGQMSFQAYIVAKFTCRYLTALLRTHSF